MTTIGERLGLLMQHYRLNKNTLSIRIGGTSNSVIGRIVNDPERSPSFDILQLIVEAFPEINVRWLVTGKGDMLGKEQAAKSEKGEIRYFKVEPGEPFPLETKGAKAVAINVIYGFTDCESAFDVVGDSMAPRFKHGDIVFCADNMKKPIKFGEAYLIVMGNESLIRFIKNCPEETSYTLSAENPRFGDYEVIKADITQLFLIKGILRREVL